MRGKIKILFVYTDLSSFVKNDLEILQRHFDVKPIRWTRTKDIKNVLRVIWHILRADLSFVWFAGGHAARVIFFSNFFRKKTIIVVGGYEVANVPEIGYGLMTSPKSASRVKYVLENADKVLAVSEFNKKEILKYTNHKNAELIYNGVDIDKFKPIGEKKDNLVITTAMPHQNIKIKGLETFVNAAKLLPEKRFVVTGLSESVINHLEKLATPNVKFIGFLSQEDLIQYYQRAKVYCQLSYRESFGMALAEAMACECVPVVTDNAALPEVVGDTGFYVPYGDPKATAEAIEKALNSNKGKEARERTKNMFPIERREKELKEMINNIIYC